MDWLILEKTTFHASSLPRFHASILPRFVLCFTISVFGHDRYQCGNCVASRRSIFGIRNSSQRKAGGSLGNPYFFLSFAFRLEILRGPVTHVYSWPRLFGKRTWQFSGNFVARAAFSELKMISTVPI